MEVSNRKLNQMSFVVVVAAVVGYLDVTRFLKYGIHALNMLMFALFKKV